MNTKIRNAAKCLILAVVLGAGLAWPGLSAAAADPPAGPAVLKARRELSWETRQRLGLTIPKLKAAAERLRAAGQLDADASHAEIAAALVADLHERAAAADQLRAVDWDAVLKFVEFLVPLLIKLLGW